MSKQNPQVDDYLNRVKTWKQEARLLRNILLDSELTEDFKWNKPCYTFGSSNVVILQRFKESCALLFTKGVLINDPQNLLEKPGKNSQAGRRIVFSDTDDISRLEPVLRAYIKDAIRIERSGLKVQFRKNPEPVPDELEARFREMPELKVAFKSLTPGRQRAYILHFSAAKQSSTRASRIEKCTARILQSKGLNDQMP